MIRDGRPRDRVPDHGSVMWSTVPLWRLLITLAVAGTMSLGCFWWAGVAHGSKGPGFLVALGALAGSAALGCLLLIAWHGGARLFRRRHRPS